MFFFLLFISIHCLFWQRSFCHTEYFFFKKKTSEFWKRSLWEESRLVSMLYLIVIWFKEAVPLIMFNLLLVGCCFWQSDIFLICSNAMEYNSSDTIYFRQVFTRFKISTLSVQVFVPPGYYWSLSINCRLALSKNLQRRILQISEQKVSTVSMNQSQPRAEADHHWRNLAGLLQLSVSRPILLLMLGLQMPGPVGGPPHS